MQRHPDLHGCGLSKAACDAVLKQRFGKCVEMTADQRTPTQCRLWATSVVDGRPLCSMHAGVILIRQIEAAKQAARQVEINGRIDAWIDWRKTHPSIHDPMPADYQSQ